jgi:hypothetical protein
MKNILSFIEKHQLAAKAGMIAPLLFVGIFTLEGWFRPNYRPLSMYVSALSLGARGWIQITNFIIFGVLLLVFTSGVFSEFREGKAAKSGIVLLVILACSYLFSGPFVMDAMGTLRQDFSIHGTIHGILGGIAFSIMPITCFIFSRRFREVPKWQSFQNGTFFLGITSTLAVILLTIATKFPSMEDYFKNWIGLIQRLAIVSFMVWVFLFALRLYKKTPKTSPNVLTTNA